MKIRTLIVFIAVLAALSIAVFLARRPEASAPTDDRVGRSLADSALLEKAAQIRLNDENKSVTLVRTADGGWQVPDYFDLPADFTKVAGFAASLTDGKIDRLVTRSPERIARLEFKDTHVALLDADGKELWKVTLGKTSDAGGRYLRFGDEPKAYLIAANLWLDLDAKNWADTRLLDLKADDIAKVEVGFTDNKPVTVSRTKKDQPWSADDAPSGQRVSADKIAALLGSLGSLRFMDTADPAAPNVVAAKAHTRTVKFTTFDGKTVSIALGRKPEEKKPKPPAPAPVPASDSAKTDEKPVPEKPAEAPKPAAPEFETIPAGPVYAFIANSETKAPINGFMQKRGFEISEYVLNSLPAKPADLFEALPAAPAPALEAKPADPQKP